MSIIDITQQCINNTRFSMLKNRFLFIKTWLLLACRDKIVTFMKSYLPLTKLGIFSQQTIGMWKLS